MEEIFEIVLEYASIWGPSIAAMIGIVVSGLITISKVLKAIENFKADATLRDINTKLDNALKQNKELAKANRALLDQLTKVHNYLPEE